jgi:hypothetical protein
MNDKDAPQDDTQQAPPALADIEFESLGRFPVLNPQTAEPTLQQAEPAPFKLGEDAPLQRFSHPDQARAHTLAMLQQARHSINLYSPDLEPWLYNHSAVEQALRTFLLASPRNRLRILLKDSSRAIKEGHRLIALARRLPSNCQIRKLNPHYPIDDHCALLIDECGVLLRTGADPYNGYVLYNEPARLRQRLELFTQSWESSISDPDLRSFLL